jgi:hypothetical protein
MIRRALRPLVLAWAVAMSPGPVAFAAADAPTPPTDAKRFVLAPSVTLSDVGLDTNILTAPEAQKRDTTTTLALQLEPAFPVGPLHVKGRVEGRLEYFRHSTFERSVDSANDVAIEFHGERVTGYATGAFVRTRDRFDPEIYLRTQRTEKSVEAGGAFRMGGKTLVGTTVRESHVAFDAIEALLAAGLRLNRQVTTRTVSLRHAVTRLTTVALVSDVQRDRFAPTPARNANSTRVVAGVELKPTALISGNAYLGYRWLGSPSHDDPRVHGAVGSLDLSYVLADSIRWSVQAQRDVEHSFRLAEPYVISTHVSVSMTKRINTVWDISATTSREWRDYTSIGPRPLPLDDELTGPTSTSLDTFSQHTVATTCLVGDSAQVGITADYYHFDTHLIDHPYERLRVVGSIAYRF